MRERFPLKPENYRNLIMQDLVLERELVEAQASRERDGNTPEIARRIRDLRRERRKVQIAIRYEKEKNPYLAVQNGAFAYQFLLAARELIHPDLYKKIYEAAQTKFPTNVATCVSQSQPTEK